MKARTPASFTPTQTAGLILGPAAFTVLLLWCDLDPGNPAVTRMAAATVWIAVWWITEAVPIPVTSLLPLVLFPLLGILPGAGTAPHYMNSYIFLFMGGFIIALAMERWNLHRRIALGVILLIGNQPRRIVLGFMAAAAFLSMWISNTATAMLMLPIALSVLTRAGSSAEEDGAAGKSGLAGYACIGTNADPDRRRFGLALMLGIAYGASIGGIGTLVGTPPNIVFSRIFSQTFPQGPDISFARWCLLGVPFAAVFLLVAWGFLVFVACPLKGRAGGRSAEAVGEEYRKLGSMTPPEKRVLACFAATALLWFFRCDIDFGGFTAPGWSDLLGLRNLVDDGTVAVAMAIVLFLAPSGRPHPSGPEGTGGHRLMNWKTAVKLPWGILLLFGGGFALAAGMQESGLSRWISSHFHLLAGAPEWVLVLAVCLVMTFLTEITSNTATTTMVLPILAAVSVGSLGVNPLLVMIPATISASCAFMLPVATPPNAIVFSSGMIPMGRMASIGVFMNFMGAFLVLLVLELLAKAVFGIESGVLPPWAAGG